jgi:hypothetical protein
MIRISSPIHFDLVLWMQTSHMMKVLKHFCGPIYENKGSLD